MSEHSNYIDKNTSQGSLFDSLFQDQPLQRRHSNARLFHSPDPHKLYYKGVSLKERLENKKGVLPLALRSVLESLDWSEFEDIYDAQGRAPFAPMCMVGLIIYCATIGITSVRGIARAAEFDMQAQWVTGGIEPDYSTISKFFSRHKDMLSESLFIAITQEIVKRMGLKQDAVLAIDGTVIEAASSRFSMLQKEGLKAALKEATDCGAADKEQRVEVLEKTIRTLDERIEKKIRKGCSDASIANTVIHPQEPEAVLQKQKKGYFRPSYKPSITTNKDQIIVGQSVHPSNENDVIDAMLNQHSEIMKAAASDATLKEDNDLQTVVLADAGYNNATAIGAIIEHDMEPLIPEGKHGKAERNNGKGYFPKSMFTYDEENDVYTCPAGELLHSLKKDINVTIYQSKAKICANCSVRKQCTTAKFGRGIKRYAHDALKKLMLEKLLTQEGQKIYEQRQWMAETPFAVMRGTQSFNRFRRIGLAKVQAEFSIQSMAYNIRKLANHFRNQPSGGLYGFYCRILGYLAMVIGTTTPRWNIST